MTPGALAWLGRLPLVALLVLPALAAAVAATAAPALAPAALWALVAVSALLGVLLAHEVRELGRRAPLAGRELRATHARVIREVGHPEVVRRIVGASRETVSSVSENTSRLLAELVRTEEATRAQLAGELHDTVAQTLAVALRQLDAECPEHGAGVEAVREAEDELRGVLSRIRPPELSGGDLAAAIADLCSELRGRYGVTVHVAWPDVSVPLSAALATTAYRFVQESLLNAVEHADGVGLRLDVDVTDDWELQATVTDRGPGFRPEDVDSSRGRHVGLRIARERARLAGGRLDVASRLGVGTVVTLRLPLSLGERPVRLRSA